ncbi:fibronectin type III domain-containing protein [Gottfriedia acidiceleris]|uniref:fibronectin type III domain-containing protein n=1 Tax=Gottfriedia acidiceleris TaxID=371036 RepID=UPI003390DDE9
MAKRPEGLSPNFNSIVSPDISSSLIFSWAFIKENTSDFQKSAQIKVYEEGSNTALVTLSVGAENEVDLSSYVSNFDLEQTYEWEVGVTAANNSTALSGKKKFKYASVFSKDGLTWPTGPDAYEYIGTRKYFDEIQSNAISVLSDYVVDSTEETKAMTDANALFSSDVVPSRTDFERIERILGLIATKESTYKDEVLRLIEDGLGAQDIHKIYTLFDRLSKIPPQAPSNIYLTFDGFTPLVIEDGNVFNSGDNDLSVDINWTPSSLESGTCSVNFFNELTEDVSYYVVELSVGFTDSSCTHTLIYRVEDLEDANRSIDIPMDHINFEHLSSTKKTQYVLRATAVDKRQDESSMYSKVYNVSNVPLGVLTYQLRAQQKDLLDQKVIKDYYDIYNGTSKAYVHKVTGNVDGVYHYAVRLTDKNGSISPWFYIPDEVKIDPLKPPAAPKPTIKSTDTDSITITWGYVKEADKYEIDPQFGSSGNSVVTTNTKTYSSLNENTTYTFKVRATNKAGSSVWVSISGKTKPKPIVEYVQKSLRCRTWRTSYYIHKQNGSVTRPPAEYRTEMDNEEVIHGEWVELRDKVESGIAVKKGTRWGNHKSLYFLDYSGWQNRLNDKEIIDVKFYIRRKSTAHGYPDDGRFLHVWAHNYTSAGSLPKESVGPTLTDHFKVEKLDWDRGQGQWVTLPKSYGEKIRDGKIKGFAFYHPTSDQSPYSYMRFDADTIQFKIRYK